MQPYTPIDPSELTAESHQELRRAGDYERDAFFVAAGEWTARFCRRLAEEAANRVTQFAAAHATRRIESGGWYAPS